MSDQNRTPGQTQDRDMASDEALVDRLIRRDESALQPLYERHSRLLYSVALRITGDVRIAQELLQDTFVQLWTKVSQFDVAKGSLIGWLLAITRYRAISRSRQMKNRIFDESLREEAIPAVQNSGSTILDQQIARQLVSVALLGLSEVQRESITLAYFDGLTCDEVAVRTSSPVGTVKTRMRAALRSMKRTLSNPTASASVQTTEFPATLESILITEQLLCRGCRKRGSVLEANSLKALAQVADAWPDHLIDCFLQMAIELCGAGTAGLSLLETNCSGERVFRWTNLSGRLAKHVGGTTPRNFSPCGITLDRNSPQLFAYPGRYFDYFNQVEVPIVEGLVIPFHVGTKTEGTIWIVSHDSETKFDSEDERIMTSLAEFVGCAVHLKATGENATTE
jgi:RNA polymerase sigma factor (sigma-70 family)